MAVEGANGLIAAIADAHSLEEAGDKILRALTDGTLGSVSAPYGGFIALDGNLTEALLAQIAVDPVFQQADLRVAPASPGKATRLLPLVEAGNATLYVNLEEAGLLCQTEFPDAASAADGMVTRGAKRALVTDGGRASADGSAEGIITRQPPEVLVTRVTGAGDSFMAAHIVAEARGADREAALMAAQAAAAAHVSGETPYD
jgi:sugar/nucleoside kinase (ribokinase family)